IDALSGEGDPRAFRFALPKVKVNPLHTSFSGMKTAAIEAIRAEEQRSGPVLSKKFQADLAASFQAGVVRALRTVAARALEIFPAKQLAVTGGVACNRALRAAFHDLAEERGVPLFVPPPKYCTDNGAMIAWVGERYLAAGEESPLSLNALARAPLG
ncbi:MAG: tRNA (adenosine(37)-N6)-threonylcarbamoyltransferase complex transferase subunit TsaD, partial [Candidatus Binatia bacterium]